MKRMLVLAIAALAMPLAAQQPKPAPAPQKQVAIVNGEIITAERFEQMWNNMGAPMRDQYEKAGGRSAFLENYLRKRLVIQHTIRYTKLRPDQHHRKKEAQEASPKRQEPGQRYQPAATAASAVSAA